MCRINGYPDQSLIGVVSYSDRSWAVFNISYFLHSQQILDSHLLGTRKSQPIEARSVLSIVFHDDKIDIL